MPLAGLSGQIVAGRQLDATDPHDPALEDHSSLLGALNVPSRDFH